MKQECYTEGLKIRKSSRKSIIALEIKKPTNVLVNDVDDIFPERKAKNESRSQKDF